MSDKIRSDHLERGAYVYVRQSSLQQVRHHREGQQRQYGLADRARHLGFMRVVVIDDDLGTSGLKPAWIDEWIERHARGAEDWRAAEHGSMHGGVS